LQEDFRVQPLLAFFANNAHLFVAHTLRLNFQELTAQVVSALLLVERGALQVRAVELEICTTDSIDPDLLRLLESPLTLSIRTSVIRVRLARTKRKVIEQMLNSLLDWVHRGSDSGGNNAAAGHAPALPPPQQQPHRTLNVDVCFHFSELAMATDKFANGIDEMVQVW
jgi:hypothetical protein